MFIIFIILVVFIIQTITLVRIHPYQTTYYNVFIGGPHGAVDRYELDYWAASYREAVKRLSDYLKSKEFVIGPPMSAVYYFPKNFQFVTDIKDADFAISFTRWNSHTSLPGKKIIDIKRSEVLLSVIHEL